MDVHFFGSSCAAGYYLKNKLKNSKLFSNIIFYSRKSTNNQYIELNNPGLSLSNKNNSCLVSLLPIWVFAKIIEKLDINNTYFLERVSSIVACSSSSSVTKRYASNHYDKALVSKLIDAEEIIYNICLKYSINLKVLRPSLVYGKGGVYNDNNISKLILIMRASPLIILPSKSGLRQPLHASQLSDIAFYFLKNSLNINYKDKTKTFVEIGGDSEITYKKMLLLIRKKLSKKDLARMCLIISIPRRLFSVFFFPFILISPRIFYALDRISSDLSGFIPIHKILNEDQRSFPIDL